MLKLRFIEIQDRELIIEDPKKAEKNRRLYLFPKSTYPKRPLFMIIRCAGSSTSIMSAPIHSARSQRLMARNLMDWAETNKKSTNNPMGCPQNSLEQNFNSPFFLFFLLRVPPFQLPLSFFLLFRLLFSLLLWLLSVLQLPALLFYLVS